MAPTPETGRLAALATATRETCDAAPAPPPEMQAGPGLDVVLEGDTFSYKRAIQTPNGPLEIVYKGTVNRDTFTGTGKVAGFSVPYNGVRIKPLG